MRGMFTIGMSSYIGIITYLFIEILIYFRDFLSSFCIPRRDFFVILGYCIVTFWCITVSLYYHAYSYVLITDI